MRPRTFDTRTQLRHMSEKSSKPSNFGQSRPLPVMQPYGNSTRKCYNCTGLGHVSRDCPSRKSTFGTTSSAKVGAFQGRGVYDRKERIDEDFRHRGTSRTRPWRGRGRGRDREEATLGQEYRPNQQSSDHVGLCVSFPTQSTVTVTQSNKGIALTSWSHDWRSKMFVTEGKVGKHTLSVLRDTGCSGVVIRRSLINDDQLVGRFQKCTMINGQSISSPIARVYINTPYFTGDVEAWCMDTPIYDLVVGNIEGVTDRVEPYLPNQKSITVLLYNHST